MSGIEKICEFSGVSPDHPIYGSRIMYRWKRNGIQVMPKYWPLFRDCDHALVIESFEVNEWLFNGYSTPCAWQAGDYNSALDYIRDKEKNGRRFRIQYQYALLVNDPELLGEVKGVYREWTHDLSAMIRKMRRLVGPGLIIENQLPGSRGHLLKLWRKEFQQKRDEILDRELREEREAEERAEARMDKENAS